MTQEPTRLAFGEGCHHRGAAGVDGRTFEDIEAYGVERWLGELAEDLKKKTYRPSAVRRVWIPKPDGRKRPLGIPTVRDRAAQMAAVLVLAPILRRILLPSSTPTGPAGGRWMRCGTFTGF